ncbi:MAG TPA: hypothetical protein VEY33_01195 [Gemmatimonadota bacterium]|nr:hypothetical protein [Gemmatimonadota bacterium]
MALIQRTILIAAAVVGLGGIVGVPAAGGHGEVIRLGAPSVSAGDSLAVTGEEFGVRAEITLVLEGAAGRTVLANLRADGEGRFETTVSIPVEAPAGAYRIVAEAGEDRATADLLVTASVAGMRMEGHPAAVHGAGAATSEKMSLDRRRSAAESTLAWGLVGALVLLGAWLARGARFTA